MQLIVKQWGENRIICTALSARVCRRGIMFRKIGEILLPILKLFIFYIVFSFSFFTQYFTIYIIFNQEDITCPKLTVEYYRQYISILTGHIRQRLKSEEDSRKNTLQLKAASLHCVSEAYGIKWTQSVSRDYSVKRKKIRKNKYVPNNMQYVTRPYTRI